MKLQDKTIITIIIFIIFIWFLYLVRSILTPFIFSLAIAYFLDPLVDRMQKCKLSRGTAALLVLIIFILTIATALTLFLPLLFHQFSNLIASLPRYIDIFSTSLYPQTIKFLNRFGINPNFNPTQYFTNENLPKLLSFSNNIIGNIMRSTKLLINLLSLIFIAPILVFYFLRDWHSLINKINQYLPSNHAPMIRRIFKEIDKTLHGYVRGQFNVCLILGLIYATGFTIAGLNFGFLIGFLIGLMSFIPYVGMMIGVTIVAIVGIFEWGFNLESFAIIGLIFLIGQIIESSFLTPKLIGSKIGLHPAWIIFGLFVCASLFGFIGVIFSVPLTAIIAVLVKVSLTEYKHS